jgi:hypothetical protein
MYVPGGNALDRQLRLTPADYAADPHAFGRRPVTFVLPARGDDRSRRVAQQQHRLVLSWRETDSSGAAVAGDWGFSRQTWSRVVLGQRWAGAVVLCAMLAATSAYAGPVTKGDGRSQDAPGR